MEANTRHAWYAIVAILIVSCGGCAYTAGEVMRPKANVAGGHLEADKVYLCAIKSGDLECVDYAAFLQWKGQQDKAEPDDSM